MHILSRLPAVTGLAALACFSGCIPYVRTYAPPVSGQMFDARSHRPIADARVYTTDDRRRIAAETRTAPDGTFSLPAKTGWSLAVPGQPDFPPPRLVVEAGTRRPQEVAVDYEPTWLRLENAVARPLPSDGGFALGPVR